MSIWSASSGLGIEPWLSTALDAPAGSHRERPRPAAASPATRNASRRENFDPVASVIVASPPNVSTHVRAGRREVCHHMMQAASLEGSTTTRYCQSPASSAIKSTQLCPTLHWQTGAPGGLLLRLSC